jgi:hypothetical protein
MMGGLRDRRNRLMTLDAQAGECPFGVWYGRPEELSRMLGYNQTGKHDVDT